VKSPKAPKEDPQAKADRLRERRLTELDQTAAAQDQAAALTSDLRAVYGLKGLGRGGAFRPASPTVGSSNAITGPKAYGGLTGEAIPNTPMGRARIATLPSYLRPLSMQNGQSR
jgi:hypothetical protein